VAERDVFYVEEHLVAALAVPHLSPGAARLGEDRTHGHVRPRLAVPVPVPLGVVRVRSRVDGASHLGHPQLHRLEAAVRSSQRVEERGRLGPALRRQRA